MGLRPGRCYRKIHRPYTRQSQKKPRKGYVKGVPKSKITQFEFGKKGNYDTAVYLLSDNDVQIRHNSLDSARVVVVQYMEKAMGKNPQFLMRVRVFPHHVIRENCLATGAGADRFQSGMRQSFGQPIGTAAQVRKNQKIIEIQVNKNNINIAKTALKKASYKLPTTTTIKIEENKIPFVTHE